MKPGTNGRKKESREQFAKRVSKELRKEAARIRKDAEKQAAPLEKAAERMLADKK